MIIIKCSWCLITVIPFNPAKINHDFLIKNIAYIDSSWITGNCTILFFRLLSYTIERSEDIQKSKIINNLIIIIGHEIMA